MHTKNGYTLIELLIVVTIVSILAAIALFTYQNYLARTQVSEAMVLADGLKSTIAADLANNVCGSEVSTGTYGSAIVGGTAPNCTITFTFNNTNVAPAIKSKVLVLDMAADSTLKINPATTIDKRYLPSSIQ